MPQPINNATNAKTPTRRRFLAVLGIGAAAVALVAGAGFLGRPKASAATTADPFPAPGSIFHPAQDPRTDPRR